MCVHASVLQVCNGSAVYFLATSVFASGHKSSPRQLTFVTFLPRDSYAKRGICRRRVSVCLSVCLSHSGIVSKRLNE